MRLRYYENHPRVALAKDSWTVVGKTPLTLVCSDEEPIEVVVADTPPAKAYIDVVANGSLVGRTLGSAIVGFNAVNGVKNVYARGAYKASSVVVQLGTVPGAAFRD